MGSQPSDRTSPASYRVALDMVHIPAGTYPMGRDDAAPDERPAHRVRLDSYRIDRTEVTNTAFAEYLEALALDLDAEFEAGGLGADSGEHSVVLLREGFEGSGLYPIIALDDAQTRIGRRDGRFFVTPGFERHPVTETTWAGARAYCAWRAARLPSEAEWEAAARGEEGLLYPWGLGLPDAERVHLHGRTGETAQVGARPAGASPFGILDLSGSLAEWTSTLKRPYPYDPADGREASDAPGERVTRGGDYLYDAEPSTLTATHRNGFSNAPERGYRHIGFRCASSGA